MSRECGDCRACCKAFQIDALDSPAGEWCHHACDEGCGIYDSPDRPDICHSFECIWLSNPDAFTDQERPDRVGIILRSTRGHVFAVKVCQEQPLRERAKRLIERLEIEIQQGNTTPVQATIGVT